MFEEFSERLSQCILVAATPANYELDVSTVVAEQVVRPTGLLDPKIDVRMQIPNFNIVIIQILAELLRHSFS